MKQSGSPWSTDDVLRAAGMVAAGGVMCVIAWATISARPRVGSQVGFVPLAVGGLVVAFLGQAAWLLRGRRALGERARMLLGAPPAAGPRRSTAIARATDLVAGEGLRWFHRADCPLAANQGFAASHGEHTRAGRHPCRVCQP
jgi:hypothetical protein